MIYEFRTKTHKLTLNEQSEDVAKAKAENWCRENGDDVSVLRLHDVRQSYDDWLKEHEQSLCRRYLHEVPVECEGVGEVLTEERAMTFQEYCERQYQYSV